MILIKRILIKKNACSPCEKDDKITLYFKAKKQVFCNTYQVSIESMFRYNKFDVEGNIYLVINLR